MTIVYYSVSQTFDMNETMKCTNTMININNTKINVNQYENHVYQTCRYVPNDKDNVHIIGHANVIEEIKYIHDIIESNIEDECVPRILLLHGPPGTGKSTLAKSMANILGNIPFLHVSIDQIENKFYGEGLKTLRSIFTLSNKISPCVIFFDEIDGIMNIRNDNDQSHTTSLKTTFLTCMDELKRYQNVYLIAATNRPASLDNAFMRRMDVHMEMTSPSSEDKFEYISNKLKINLSDDNADSAKEWMNYIQEYWPSPSSINDIERFYKFLKRHWWIQNKTQLPCDVSLEHVKIFSNKYKKYIYGIVSSQAVSL
jgi:AAA+ superfamily predicted ATPase